MFMPVLCPTCWNVVQASARSHLGILVREKHLDPLGGAGPDDCKRFATAYVEQFSKNRQWLDQATDAIYKSRTKK
jgi:hypothetical protein